jgi:regulatory protein
MLARRPYSVAELRRSLEKKFPAADLAPTIARLRQLGYLNDQKVAESYALALARNRAYGPHRIRRELQRRLFDYRAIDAAVQKAFESVNASELLERAVDKKIRSLRKPLTRPKLASLCQSLIRRGFRPDDIMKAVRARPELRLAGEDVNPADLEERQ